MAVDSDGQIDQQRRFEGFVETTDSQNNTLLSDNGYQPVFKTLKGEKSI